MVRPGPSPRHRGSLQNSGKNCGSPAFRPIVNRPKVILSTAQRSPLCRSN